MSILPLATYDLFVDELVKRLNTKAHLTEDSVRYTFFHALLKTTGIQQHEVILELPHPQAPGNEVDTFVPATDGRPNLFFEFKYHRRTKSVSGTPNKAGALFKDISRLASLITNDSHRLVVYLTCAQMAPYFTKPASSYSSFWAVKTSTEFMYDGVCVANTNASFRKQSGPHHPARVVVEYSASLPLGHHVRVFDVRRLGAASGCSATNSEPRTSGCLYPTETGLS